MRRETNFFWYDLETFGTDAWRDRPVQFAGLRTNYNLAEIGPEQLLYCRPPLDYLPQVEACLVHGITPQEARDQGVSEHEFATGIHRLLTRPNTCAVGFNAMKFDHELIRFLFWRNLRDPYRWHWADGNARWCITDLFRMAYATRLDTLRWTLKDDGRPSFRLADLARANEIAQWAPHSALSDVEATLGLARLMRERNPDLFEESLRLSDKRVVAREVAGPFVYVSGSVLHWRGSATVLAPVAQDGRGSLFAVDLSVDPAQLRDLEDSELLARTGGADAALYKIKVNKAPFVRRISLAGRNRKDTQDLLRALNLDHYTLRRRWQFLRDCPDLHARVRAAFESRWNTDSDDDVDVALYRGGFIARSDRALLNKILASTRAPGEHWEWSPFRDERLHTLVFRFRARNFPDSLSRRDAARWHSHCAEVLFRVPDEDGLTRYQQYTQAIAAHRREPITDDQRSILDALEDYGRELKARLV